MGQGIEIAHRSGLRFEDRLICPDPALIPEGRDMPECTDRRHGQ